MMTLAAGAMLLMPAFASAQTILDDGQPAIEARLTDGETVEQVLAQTEGETTPETGAEAPDEEAPATPADEAPADEAAADEAPAEEAPAEEAPAEEPAPEGTGTSTSATEAAAPAAAAAAGAAAAPKSPEDVVSEAGAAADATATGGTLSPTDAAAIDDSVETAGEVKAEAADAAARKPWRLQGTVEMTVGGGSFNPSDDGLVPRADPEASATGGGAGTALVGYNVRLRGYYDVTDIFQAYAGWDFNQELTQSYVGLGVGPNQFFPGDVRLGALSPTFYSEDDLTGIKFGGAFTMRLPTSYQSQAIGRVMRLDLGANASRTWKDIGPGSLTWTIISAGIRKDFGDENRELSLEDAASIVAACRTSNVADQGGCITNIIGVNWGLNYGTTLTYSFLESFSLSAGISMTHNYAYSAGDSGGDEEITTAATGEPTAIGSSQNAFGQMRQSDFLSGTIEAGYTVNEYFGARLGMSTFQNPLRQSGDNSESVAFAFWDNTGNSAGSNTTFYLDLNFFY